MKIFILIILFLFCQMTTAQTFDIQGHRGCRGLMPENTIPAFLKALDLGVTTLELDVVISKDRKVVVSHEPFFNPDISTDPTGKPVAKGSHINLYELNYDQIRQYDCGLRGNPNFAEQQKIKAHKPLLEDMILAVEQYRKDKKLPIFNYNIEIKSEENEYEKSQPKPDDFSDLVYGILLKHIDLQRITLQSFDFNVLKHWHKQIATKKYKKVNLAALVANAKGIEANLENLGFMPDIYSPYYKLLDKKRIEKLHSLGIRVIPWTANTTTEIIELRAMGVDGIITDYPDRAR